MAGEIPHRDFDEPYTGGLTYLNAVAFRLFGDRLISLRRVLLGFYLLWIPCVYFIASRFESPPVAAVVTLAAAAWSIPNYPAAVPSWYNLFFATAGAAALLRSLDRKTSGWLFVAGLAGGVSCLFKITGVYFSVAALGFLVLDETLTRPHPSTEVARHLRVRRAAVCAIALAVAAAATVALGRRSTSEFVAFALPVVALAMLWAGVEFRRQNGPDRQRLAALLRQLGMFVAGVAIPLLAFGAFYWLNGGLPDLVREVFVTPARRLTSTAAVLPDFSFAAVPVLLLVGALATSWRVTQGWLVGLAVAAGLAAILVAAKTSVDAYHLAWAPVIYLEALMAVLALWLLRSRTGAVDLRTRGVLLLLCVTALCGLIQIPFAVPIYFCYAAPLVLVTLAAIISRPDARLRVAAVALSAFYGLFAVLRMVPGSIDVLGHGAVADRLTASMMLSKAVGLRVLPDNATTTDWLIYQVRVHAGDRPIYAAPDCPEVYYLSGHANPTRTIYEFLSDPKPTTEETLRTISQARVKVVVINHSPEFSAPMSEALEGQLRERYPNVASVGPFDVRWQ